MKLSEYRIMWIFAMFDLPTDTKQARKSYTLFRRNLLKDGFHMVQYSVYARCCSSEENLNVHYKRIKAFLPPEGEVRLVKVTDKQYGNMQTYWGKIRKAREKTPSQLELF